MATPPTREQSILIVGGGTFGISTAYHLAERGYKSITVLDRFSQPSPESAGNDINKVVRSDYSEQLYTRLAGEAMEMWKDSSTMFHQFFHGTGWLIAAGNVSIPFMEASLANAKASGVPARYMSKEDVSARWPALTGAMEDWRIMWSPTAGWVDAVGAQTAMAAATDQMGVEYISGDAGYVQRLLFDEDSKCIGAMSRDGSIHKADIVILAAGAAAAGLLDMEGQLTAKGHTVCFLQLTAEEAEKYEKIPIFDNLEQGICFPPDKNGIMKLATVEWFTNKINTAMPGVSLPRYRSDNPTDTIPVAYEAKIRKFIKSLIPELADRPWSRTHICWDAETADLHFLITPHPSHANLKLAVGGSAHGFKFLPTIGRYIADMVEGRLDDDLAKHWRWRPGATKQRTGPEPHPFEPLDLSQLSLLETGGDSCR